ncbi:unnamed protein product [Ambrosiozyma monospora]|uniref:Unnamed protein product n=1 Tax=Ambrosiozyma monospora TaxID=43982 RepID=A0ACB5T8D5_AMBMO|nr:unnamed protein product [Ambrosiozyma monospora]
MTSDESENDFLSEDEISDDEQQVQRVTKKKQIDKFNTVNSDDDDDDDDDNYSDYDDKDDEDESKPNHNTSHSKQRPSQDDDNEDQSHEDEDVESNIYDDFNKELENIKPKDINKTLSKEKLEKQQQKIKKSGVIYLSSIPPYMKPAKLRSILSKFGKVGRIYLKPESEKEYKRRIKTGGNKKKKFDEGWAEFINKKDAKLCASTLNGNKIGGKKGNFYYDDIMNIKYLKGFKWFDLTNSINKEIEIRENKFQMELSQQQKINKTFIKNVETNKLIQQIKSKKNKKRNADDASEDHGKDDGEVEKKKPKVEVRRTFQQRSVTTNRADADSEIKNKNSKSAKLNSVLNSIF